MFFSNAEEIKAILDLDQSTEDSTLHAILDPDIFLMLLQFENSNYYSVTSWLIILQDQNLRNMSSSSFLRTTLSSHQSLRLDSRLYFVVFDKNLNEADLIEAYKVIFICPIAGAGPSQMYKTPKTWWCTAAATATFYSAKFR